LHPQQCSFLSLARRIHEPRSQSRNNHRQNTFGKQSFPVTTQIWNKEAMHELGDNKGDKPDHNDTTMTRGVIPPATTTVWILGRSSRAI
jgi:hypothetical protein